MPPRPLLVATLAAIDLAWVVFPGAGSLAPALLLSALLGAGLVGLGVVLALALPAGARGARAPAERAALAHITAAREVLEAEPAGHELAMAYTALAQQCWNMVRPQESIEWGERALSLADVLGDGVVQANALVYIGLSQALLGAPWRAIECLERSLAAAKRAGAVQEMLNAYRHLGATFVGLGEYRRGAGVLREGLAVARRHSWEVRMSGDCGYPLGAVRRWSSASGSRRTRHWIGPLARAVCPHQLLLHAECYVRMSPIPASPLGTVWRAAGAAWAGRAVQEAASCSSPRSSSLPPPGRGCSPPRRRCPAQPTPATNSSPSSAAGRACRPRHGPAAREPGRWRSPASER